MKTRVLVLIAAISLAGVAAWAHGGEEHVMGTVTKVSDNSITVKTTAKEPVTVDVAPKTTFSTAKHAAKLADLKAGDRVVIHATEPEEGKLVADTVEFSTPKPAAAAPHVASHVAPGAKQTPPK